MSQTDLKKIWKSVVSPPQGWQGDLYFYNRLNQKIRYGYAPANGDKKGTIVLTHGYAEHIDLYYEAIKKYQDMGYEVWALDWQGHGMSERDDPDRPAKPSTRGMMRHVKDLDFFVNNLVKTQHDPNTPLVMSTHSMGGHIGLLYMKKFPGVFDGAVLSAPMFDIHRLGLGRWSRPFIRTLFNVASMIGFRDVHVPTTESLLKPFGKTGQFLKRVFSRPSTLRGEFRELMKELTPDAHLERPTFGWVAETFNTVIPSMEEDFLASIKTPVLIGSADEEDLVDNDAHIRAAGIMPYATRVKIDNAGHGLWFEDEKSHDAWWTHITKFLENLKALNPHERDNDDTVNNIVAGKNIEKTLRGRTIFAKRCPADRCDIKLPDEPDGPNPS